MPITTNHRPAPSDLFGTVHRPAVEVEFKVKGRDDWLQAPMIVDTGADYTILPRWLAGDLNIDLESDCERHTTVGVGGTATVFLLRRMSVRLGNWTGEIPVGFLNSNNIPALLGRQDFSEKFRLILEDFTTTFVEPRNGRRNAH